MSKLGEKKRNQLSLYMLLALPFVAQAKLVDQPWLDCSKITDPNARLACFDSVTNNQLKAEIQTTSLNSADDDNTEKAPAVSLSAESGNMTATDETRPRHKPLAKDAENRELLVKAGLSEDVLQEYTPLSRLYDLDGNADGGILTLRAHRPNYYLPVWHNFKPNKTPHTPSREAFNLQDGNVRNTEVKFQLSFKTKVWEDLFGANTDLWFGYTQQSYWQLYTGSDSSPFRETNYQPEVFITQPVSYQLPFDGKLRMLGAGFVHQSNGQSDPESRSWNRIYAMAGMEWDKLTIVPRVWWRVPERTHKDDNPDITDYMGYGDLWVGYQFNRQQIASTITYNPAHNKSGIRMEYTFPVYGNLKGYAQYFEGYGENLMDYNHYSRSVGIGLMLYDWGGL